MHETLLKYLYRNIDRESDIALGYKPGLRRFSLTYAELARQAFQFARELESRDVEKGDHIVIWSENRPEWVVAFYGAMLRGAIVVPLDEQSARDFVSRVVAQTKPKLLLHGKETEFPPGDHPILAFDELAAQVSRHSSKFYEAENITRGDLVEIVFTSGTTAMPKGVRLTHENILANVEAIEVVVNKYKKWEFLVHPLRFLCLLPLSHVFGQMMGIFIPPLLRSEVFFQNRFTPAEIIRTIKRERISVAATVPRVLDSLRHKLEREYEKQGELNEFRDQRENSRNPLTRWWTFRRIHGMFGLKFWSFVTGGAALGTETERFWSKLGFAVIQGYGMTETAALVAVNNPFSAKRGSLGEILEGQDVKIGPKGEILVRGKNVSPGYTGQATAADGGRWLDTGDVGSVDETGRLYFRGRKKDVIVTSAGLKIHPEDLEAALGAQPEILDCAVVGTEGATGEETVAAIIAREGSDVRAAVARANETLAQHQQIRRWFLWPEPDFPRTPTQKVRKNEIAKLVPDQGGKSPNSTRPSDITEIIAGLRKEDRGDLESEASLGGDLHLDSLSRTELVSAIEDRYQVDLDESDFTETTTVAEVEEMIRREGVTVTDRPVYSFPYWTLSSPAAWLRKAFYFLVLLPFTRALCWVKTRGTDNLASLEGPVLFASNHISYVDSPLIMSALPNRFRGNLAIAMEGERLRRYRYPPTDASLITKIRLILQYWSVTLLMNTFPLPKTSGFRQSFEFAGDAVDAGYNVLIFPEGEMTKDGKLQEVRRGIDLLADGLKIPIVPVVIQGLFEAKAKGKRFFARPGSVEITFGEPIYYDPEESPVLSSLLEERFRVLKEGNES